MLELFWYCLEMGEEEQIGEKEQNLVSDNLDRLSSLLKTPLVGITLETKLLPPRLVKEVNGVYESWCNHDLPFSFFCKQIRVKLNFVLKDFPLLIYCKCNSKLAIAAVKENPLAKWGLTNIHYFVSAVYKPNNEYILWHEALHLFNVDDCYCCNNPDNTRSNCELSNCIMQYKPTKENVREWPFLCQKNIERIQDWDKK